jgi:hypothetical protein
MPVFSLGFSKKSGGSPNSLLLDQLQIMENGLSKDGFLSPGDYDVLINKAKELSTSPGITETQRNDYIVRISTYDKNKALINLNKEDDIAWLNNQTKSDDYLINMQLGNDPVGYLQARGDNLAGKARLLNEAIQRRQINGAPTAEHLNEYYSTISELKDIEDAATALQNNSDPATPIPGFAAYVKTNNRGEIVDVQYGRQKPSASGYVETNGVINGFQVYGMPNGKFNGENYFRLGNTKFSGADYVIPDPATGGFKNTILLDDSARKGNSTYTQGISQYKALTAADLTVQKYIPNSYYAQGPSGTIYHRDDNGIYHKYVNATKEKLGIQDNQIMNIPAQLESGLANQITDTIDFANQIKPDEENKSMPIGGTNPLSPDNANPFNQPLPMSTMSNPTPSADQMPKTGATSQANQVRRTPQKPNTAPAGGFMNTAARTMESAKNFFGNFVK